MPVFTPSTAPERAMGPATERSGSLDGYTVDVVTILEDHSLAPFLAALPGGHCRCPHWGVVTAGRITVEYPDRTEVIEAGDAFYLAPGHVPSAIAGTSFVQFSPTAELEITMAAIQAGMASVSGG